MKTLNEAIMNRISIRSYIDKPIAKVQKKQIHRFLSNTTNGPFGNKIRFELVNADNLSKQELDDINAHGISREAQQFIVGAVKPTRHSLEDFGYCMEKVILKATKLGFGTCWMTGAFNRKNFKRRINIVGDEIIPGISPLGYFQYKRSLSIQIMKLIADSRKRKAWSELFFRSSFENTLEKEAAGSYLVPLEAVRVAHSVSGKEPWRIVKAESVNIFHFYLCYNDDSGKDEVDIQACRIDIGIAMCHFEVSARELELKGSWRNLNRNGSVSRFKYITSWVGS